jgi:hypothetical protein
VGWWPCLPHGIDLSELFDLSMETAVGTPTGIVRPIFGRGLALDGSGDAQYTTLVPVAVTPLTLMFWGYSNDATAAQDAMSLSATTTVVNRFSLNFGGATAGDPIRAIHQNGGTFGIAVTSTGYAAGQIIHAAAVFETNPSRRAYINGGSPGLETTTVGTPANLERVVLGGYFNSTTSLQQDFNGGIFDARVYNRALSPAEIHACYDPATRWELYRQPIRRAYVFLADAEVTARIRRGNMLGTNRGVNRGVWRSA